MCMRMLNRRVQVLFNKDLWNKIIHLAKAHKTSVGQIVRETMESRLAREKEFEQRKSVIESILKHRPKPFKGKIDYKALINAGRH